MFIGILRLAHLRSEQSSKRSPEYGLSCIFLGTMLIVLFTKSSLVVISFSLCFLKKMFYLFEPKLNVRYEKWCLHWLQDISSQRIVNSIKWYFEQIEIAIDTERHYHGIRFSLLPIGKSMKQLLDIQMPTTDLLVHLQSSKQQNLLMLRARPDNQQPHLTLTVCSQSGACKRFKN